MTHLLTVRRSICITLLWLTGIASAWGDSVGERIYREGIVSSGAALQGDRGPGMHLTGATVACVACHRRSGLGMMEGASTIPPIAGIYLFNPRSRNGDDQNLPFVEGMRADRDPYTVETLARAIRDGIGANGKPLSMLMPRFRLDDGDMAALIDYLRTLSPGSVPGVDPTALHFATIITPDADPQTRRGVLAVLNEFFADKNHFTRAQSEHLHSAHRMMFKAYRRWALHAWELHGAAETWEAQLQAKLAAEPVFAVISGAGGHNWAPVHRFCENAGLPCLFPNVDLPVVSEHDFDSLYFSRGVLLEADLIANALTLHTPANRILQFYREGDVGADAAARLASRLTHRTLISEVLKPEAGARELATALSHLRSGDVAVLWLRSADVSHLAAVPPADVSIYLSGRMAGLEFSPLPPAWRSVTQMSYPYDLPSRSRVQLDYPLGWFRIRKIPIVARQAQIDTFLACQILSDTTNHMADTFVRDYLVERIERDVDHRIINAAYPRLALAQEQRFASKGGYLVHFANSSGPQLLADGQWTVP
ncbi:MAG: cytochrome c [Proteobacteria bacterium]|nr:cytochrome c [Pseudomonadota bacterium]